VKRGDGEWRWVDTRGVPRFSEDGEFLGHVGSCPASAARKRGTVPRVL
jgi:hypothetical protein